MKDSCRINDKVAHFPRTVTYGTYNTWVTSHRLPETNRTLSVCVRLITFSENGYMYRYADWASMYLITITIIGHLQTLC